MAPDWEKLAAEWEGNEVGYVAEIDCTAEGKPLCDANGVRGFPTLKYGDPANLEDYQGGRDLASLSKFAKENLKPVCSPTNLDLCDDEMKTQIEGFMKLSEADLKSKIAEYEKQLEDAEENFKAEVSKLQATYQQLSEAKDNTIAEVKSSGLGLLKSVLTAKTKASAGGDEL